MVEITRGSGRSKTASGTAPRMPLGRPEMPLESILIQRPVQCGGPPEERAKVTLWHGRVSSSAVPMVELTC